MRVIRKLALCGTMVVGGIFAAPVLAGPVRCPSPDEAAGGPRNAHTRYVEANLRPPVIKRGDKPFNLAERMHRYGVPGISVAVIHNGKIEWARAWGFRDYATCAPVTPRTAFQAASISKVVTAVIALLDPAEHTVHMYSAGHGPLYLYSAAENQVVTFDADQPPLGPQDRNKHGS